MISFDYLHAQEVETYVKSDTSFIAYRGKIANNHIYLFMQYLNDSTLKGYYQYTKYGKKISLEGKILLDSLHIYELDKDTTYSALFALKTGKDSITGTWSSLKGAKKYDIVLHNCRATGDIDAPNYQNTSLIIKYDQKDYEIPVTNYLVKDFNYEYVLLYTQLKKDAFYSVIRFLSHSLNKKDRNRYGWEAFEDYIMYVKFNLNQEILEEKYLKISSDIEEIQEIMKKGSLLEPFKEDFELDSYHLKEKYKNALRISRLNIDNGMSIKKIKTDISYFIFDSLQLNLEETYNLVLRFKLFSVGESTIHHYKLNSIFEKNDKDISKLSLFTKSLLERDAYNEDKEISWLNGDYYQFADYNFDGYKDIYYFDSEGSGVHNYFGKVWVYNPKSKKYELDKFLSSLPISSIDEKNKKINTYWNNGGMYYGSEKYQMVKGKMKLIYSKVSNADEKKRVQTIKTGEIINNKWVQKTQKVKW